MATRLRTEAVMDPFPSHDRHGPQIYLHVEFGVSWSRKPPRNHEVTYRSRNLRERSPHFPRQVPAPNTNYLAAIRDFDQRQAQARQARQAGPVPVRQARLHPDVQNHQMQEYYQVAPRQYEAVGLEQPRASRADSRSSHERGHSAPPPIGANPWDVNVLGREAGGAGPSTEVRQQPVDQWKALPAEPSQFRLGEGGMPWSAWSWPLEYQPDASGNTDEAASTRTMSTREEIRGAEFATGATMVSVFSPGPSGVRSHDETGRARELGALSAAMMTVDNGFENQWWNQGQREIVRTEEETCLDPRDLRSSTWSPGDATAEERVASIRAASLVSPISASDRSSIPAFHSLQRSLSTRSEELFLEMR